MPPQSKYIRSKSTYVYKDRHQNTYNGTIFERDYMTISGFDGLTSDNERKYGSSNFVFVIRDGLNRQKKHTNGEWLTESNVNEYIDVRQENEIVNNKIVFNPDYESLTDFAYYGSAVDLVRATVANVILNFPAELCFTGEEVYIVDSTYNTGGTYYKVSNDFGIDIYTEKIDDVEAAGLNLLRYYAISKDSYNIIREASQSQTGNYGEIYTSCGDCEVIVKNRETSCEDYTKGAIIADVTITLNGMVLFEMCVYREGDEIVTLAKNNYSGFRIQPNSDIVDEYYDNLDDFTKVLLNRDSVPIYTSRFNTPFETDNGYFTYRQEYTWPSLYGWNPDLNGIGFESYLERLYDLATFHDEYDTNNIWRSMTHEAIKNLDWTFTRVVGEDVEVMEDIDTSKIEPVLKIYGRQYDDLKRTIDVIGKCNIVSYDKKNNVPDYFIDDALSLAGWETTDVNPNPNRTTKISLPYSGENSWCDGNDMNDEFMRRLKINSPYILSKKGTIDGLVTLLAVFGLKNDVDYKIEESILTITSGTLSYDEVVSANKLKYNYNSAENDELYGLPVIGVSGSTGLYVVPWFEKSLKYDGDLYFQQAGGWGKTQSKEVKLPDYGISTTITSDNQFTIYDETISDLKTVGTIQDLIELGRYIVKTGDICYVTDITGLDSNLSGDASHYFYLVNDDFANIVGPITQVTENEEHNGTLYGWSAVTNTEITTMTSPIAKRIAYLENLVDDATGNNPHNGHGDYDFGQSYIDNMLDPFKYVKDNNNLIGITPQDIQNLKFRGATSVDNKKCWYFSDDAAFGNTNGLSVVVPGDNDMNFTAQPLDRPDIGINTKDFEAGSGAQIKNSEAAANSVINLKQLSIVFRKPVNINTNEYNNYLRNKILYYVKQIIPATTIFEYSIAGSSIN